VAGEAARGPEEPERRVAARGMGQRQQAEEARAGAVAARLQVAVLVGVKV